MGSVVNPVGQKAGQSNAPSAKDDEFAALIEAEPNPSGVEKFVGGVLPRQSISEQVATRIMAMIKSGNLKSGDRLPTEQQMCLAFHISRPPLREALKALTMMGVLESRQGGRYSVTDLSPSRLIAPFNVMLSVKQYDVDQHFEARAVVDLELVRLCTQRATTELRRRILELANDGSAFLDDPVAFRLHDIEFHQAINNGAENELLAIVAQGLYDIGLDVRRVASREPGVIKNSVGQHLEVANAITNHDAATAADAYKRHLLHIRDTTIQAAKKIVD
jgi:DNA-binding FadR family transcriptional regulator